MSSVMGRVRQPEYTGENRCIPCTLANLAIAVVASVAVGYGWAVVGWPLAWVAGLAVFAGSCASIWLRGYLVPGTPELTKRYFPDRLLAYFDKAPAAGAPNAGAGGTNGASGDLDPETMLSRAGVVEPCEQEDDLCLQDDFRRGWRERMRSIRADGAERAALARQLDLDPEAVTFEEHESGFVAFNEGGRIGQWESRAALVADLAAARELPDWIGGWDDLPVNARSQVLGGLRIFLDACPVCDGTVTAGTEVVESCCRSHEVVAASCADCDARLLEVPYEGETAA